MLCRPRLQPPRGDGAAPPRSALYRTIGSFRIKIRCQSAGSATYNETTGRIIAAVAACASPSIIVAIVPGTSQPPRVKRPFTIVIARESERPMAFLPISSGESGINKSRIKITAHCAA